jgi:hypothetical protein
VLTPTEAGGGLISAPCIGLVARHGNPFGGTDQPHGILGIFGVLTPTEAGGGLISAPCVGLVAIKCRTYCLCILKFSL